MAGRKLGDYPWNSRDTVTAGALNSASSRRTRIRSIFVIARSVAKPRAGAGTPSTSAGRKNITVYRARMRDEATGKITKSTARRNFCKKRGSALWLWDPQWPELVHPFASAIDTDLPVPPERTHLMPGSKASWVPVLAGPRDKKFDEYPEESIAEWHQRLGLEC